MIVVDENNFKRTLSDLSANIGESRLKKLSNYELNIPKYKLPDLSHIQETHRDFEEFFRRRNEEAIKKEQREEEYKKSVLTALHGIEKNTAEITTLVSILKSNTSKQDEIIDILTTILSISKATTNDEADNKYREVMDKMEEVKDDLETFNTLFSYAQIVWSTVKGYFKKDGIE